jgi:phenylpropionate dioxygenase-like ring-hydroxylating dioxygenase large terminal subunit
MIRNQWYALLESREVRKGKVLGAVRLGERMAFWRDGTGAVHAVADRCCHRGASLSCGELVDGQIECPFHGLLYDGSGRVTRIPANGRAAPVADRYRVRSYPVREKFGFVWLWWGEEDEDPASLPEIRFFKDLDGKEWTWSTFVDHWPVHYSRAIENQLDAIHVPFVHRTTIGAGGQTVVDGPKVEYEDGVITFYVNSHRDDGRIVARKPAEIDDYKGWFHLRFAFPNVWENLISDKLRVFAAFAPVDEANAVIYVRFVQRFLRVPGLRGLVNLIGGRFNRVVLRQDKAVVVTQRPVKTRLKMDEKLVPGDSPIAEYRVRRAEWKAAAGQVEDEGS